MAFSRTCSLILAPSTIRATLPKEKCFVIENAPLGIRAGKAAGLTVYAVNTGILTREDLAQADQVFDSMTELLMFLKQ